MVGRVRLVLQRILDGFLVLDLALFRRRCWITLTGDFGQRLTTLIVRTTKHGSATRAHLVIVAPTPLVSQEVHRPTKLSNRLVPLDKMILQGLDLLLQGFITAFKIGDLLTLTSQTTPNGIQLGASLLKTGIDTFIELEDQIIQVRDVQGLGDLQIAKLIFEVWRFRISERLNPHDSPEYLVFGEGAWRQPQRNKQSHSRDH